MASRHDSSNRRPVRNALLKWQLQQDQRRLREVQQRLMRMAAPSPASSLGVDSSVNRRPIVRRPRPMHHDPEEDALMSLIKEREEREAATSNQNERPVSRLKHPSVLPPLRRLEPKAPMNTPVKNVALRPTGQKLNAAGDFYSPVRPRESSLNSSTSEFRQSLAFSRIKAPTPVRLVGATAPLSPRNLPWYDQMKTPDRWRTTAMKSNQEDLNESTVRRWDEEDTAQADRLLEKAAREGDDDALWGDLLYDTKASRIKTNQQNHPQQSEVYSTSSFLGSNAHSPCYDAENARPKSPLKKSIGGEGRLDSELSTVSTIQPQHSEIGSPATDSNGATAPTSMQTIAEMLASMEKSTKVEPANGDLVAGDDKGCNDSSSGGDKEQFSMGESAGDCNFVQVGSPCADFPLWSMIVVVICLGIGTGGFFIEELMGLMGLFSKKTPFTLSKAEQKRMRDRVSALQHELRGFQHSTSEIEVKSQTALTELQRHMERMRLDRERHQDMLATEMQDLRRHILHVTHELVTKEQKSIQSQLQELVKVRSTNEDGHRAIAESGVENEKESEKTIGQPDESTIEDPAQSESVQPVHESSPDFSSGTQPPQDEHVHTASFGDKRSQEHVIVPAPPVIEEVVATVQTAVHLNDVPTETETMITEMDQGDAVASPQPIIELIVEPQETDHAIQVESVPQVYVEQIKVEQVQEAVVVQLSEIDHDENKIDISVTPAPKVAITTKPPRSASGMSWDGILLLVGIMFLAACVVLRVYNINRRKRWFEERRKRRNQRALLLAQRRARTMADTQDDSDEWGGDETDGGVEEVSLMTPERDDEATSEQAPEIDTGFDAQNDDEWVPYSPAEVYRMGTTEQRPTSSTRASTKSSYSRGSPLLLRQRSPRQRRHHPQY
ncbi:hypothetical protein KRP22_000949 [Phytophthora ramorum]|nr:hypothetical protein KRP22_314 [Phytophthora ramorum]